MKFAPLQPLQTGAVVHTKSRRIGVEEGKERRDITLQNFKK